MSDFSDFGGLAPLPRPGGARGFDPEVDGRSRTRSQESSPFGDLLNDTVGEVQRLRNEVGEKYDALAKGEPVSLHEIYIASGKADVAFSLMLEVRNKFLDAWQQLSRAVV